MKRGTSLATVLLIALALGLRVGLAAAGRLRPAAGGECSPAPGGFPFSGPVKGWARGNPRFFEGDRIFDYMDGAGEIPKACGYRTLGVATYTRPGSSPVTLEIYDMGSSANAFGLYSMKRYPTERFVDLDHRASLSEGDLLFWKDRYTVNVSAEGKVQAADLLSLGRATSARIKNAGALPDLLRYLPRDGYRENSVRLFHGKMALDTIKFIRQNVFELGPQTEAAVAAYEKPRGKVMVIRYPAPEAAERAMNACRRAPDARGVLVVRQGRLLGAAWDSGGGTAARQLLERVRHTLQSPGRPWAKA